MHYERGLRSKNYWRVYKDLIKKAYMRLVETGYLPEWNAKEMIQQLKDYIVGDWTKVVVNGKEVKEHGYIKDILTKYAGKELVIFFKDIDEKFCVAFYPDSGFCEIYDPTVMDEKEVEEAILAEQYRDIQPQDPWEGV